MVDQGKAKRGDSENLVVPRSVAVIMDGNGRWAKSRGLMRVRGHEHGITAVRETVEESARLGVEWLTLYVFSEENWRRPKAEVSTLMMLLKRFLVEERPRLMDNGVRLVHAGRRERLSKGVLQRLDETMELTAANTRMTLCLALSYGGRAEILDATRAILAAVQAGDLDPDDLDESTYPRFLYQPDLPDPDLVIRTAGEKRISNFLLWQASYAELSVTDVCWPDFRAEHLRDAFRDFGKRVRRFGAVIP